MTVGKGHDVKTHVVVIGGGYASVVAANRLTQRDDVAVTLANPRSRSVQRIRLHQLVDGSDDAAVSVQGVPAEGVGRRSGVFQLAHRHGTAMWLHLKGRLGAKVKGAVRKSPVKQLAEEAHKAGSHTWPVKDVKRQERLRAKQDAPPAKPTELAA